MQLELNNNQKFVENKSTGSTRKVKSWISAALYFVEKEILEPFVEQENFRYRVQGNNPSLSTMDYDGGHITNNRNVKIVEGRVVENGFQSLIFKLLKITHDLRRM